MGAATSALSSTLSSAMRYMPLIEDGIGLVSSAASTEAGYRQDAESEALALRQLQQTQAANLRQLQENAALQREEIAAEAATAESERRAALKRAVARQKSIFGASGVGNQASGSSEAVLLGLFNESDSERAAREKLDTLRYTALDQDVAQQKRINVLQLSQLKEQQKLDDLSNKIGRVTNVLNTVTGGVKLYDQYKALSD